MRRLRLPNMKSSRRKEGAGRIVGHHGKTVDNSAEFHGLFSAQFLQRYAELFEALAQPVQHVAMLNSLTDVNDCDEMGLSSFYRHGPISCLRYPEPPASYPPPPDCPYTQLRQFYWMDFASVLPPLLLAPQPHHAVLDMCAAPGGKSLVLALQLLKGVPAQQPEQISSGSAVGLTTGLLQQLALQEQQQPEQQALQDELLHVTQRQAAPELQPEPEQEPAAVAAQLDDVQHQSEVHTADDPTAAQQQQQQVPEAVAVDAAGSQGSSDAGSDDEADAAAGATVVSAGYASGAQQPGRLVCNELDPIRRQRLAGVLAAYLPGSLRRRVRLTGHDASKHWATFEAGMYDRVLLDAPCSSERHVVQQAVQGGGVVSASSWSKEHCKQLAALQLKMLLGGLRALKPGGRLVYSTCSLAEVENDAVVHKALQKQQQQQPGVEVRVVSADEWGLEGIEQLAGGERTKHGLLCLPDKQGWGPIYLAVLEKRLCE